MSDQPSAEELDAIRQHRETMAARIDTTIAEVEGQITIAEAAGDGKSAEQLRLKLPRLRSKRDEVLRGER